MEEPHIRSKSISSAPLPNLKAWLFRLLGDALNVSIIGLYIFAQRRA